MRAVVAAFLLAGCIGAPPSEDGCVDGALDEVMRIVDGDTLDGARCGRIRLALVDTPERGESGYAEASAFAAALCPVGSTMRVDIDDGQPVDTTGTRRVAAIACGERILNAALLEAGHAIVLTRFCDVSEFADDAWARAACAKEGAA